MTTSNARAARPLLAVWLAIASAACVTPKDDDNLGADDRGGGGRGGSTSGNPGTGGGTGGAPPSNPPPITSPPGADAQPSQTGAPVPGNPIDAGATGSGGGDATTSTPDAGQPGAGPAKGNLIVRSDTVLCLDVVNFPKDIILRTSGCADNALGQVFLITTDGRYTFPSRSFSIDGQWYEAGKYCLTASRNPYPQATTTVGPSLALCDAGDPAQVWDKNGAKIVSKKTSQCLSVSTTPSGSGHLASLQDCQADSSAAQEWIAGLPKDHAPKRVALISNRDSNSCVHVHDQTTAPSVRWHVCHEPESAQKFFVEENGRIRFPTTGSAKISGKEYGPGALCMTRSASSGLTLEPCTQGNGAQTWKQSGATFVSSNGECLTRSDGSEHLVSPNELPLVATAPCAPNNPLQSWTVGSWLERERERIAAIKQNAPSMSVACKAPSIIKVIDRDNNSPAMQRLSRLFGGTAGLQAHMAKTFESVCNIYYQRPEDVPLRTELHIVFWPTTSGMMTCTRVGGIASINVNDGAVNADKSRDADFKKYLDGVWHHEVGHSLQYGNGMPAGLVEGMADWTVLEHYKDLQGRGPRSAGGNWTDGYARTAYFYDWLGSTYPSPTDKRKFAARL
ncbi:MAG TPA: ricin-type beta-trefoil lectin domain protein, partial [Polyangia bacterium]